MENGFGASRGEAGQARAQRNAALRVRGSVHPMEDADLHRSHSFGAVFALEQVKLALCCSGGMVPGTSLTVVVLVICSMPVLLGGMAQPPGSWGKTGSSGVHVAWSAFGRKDPKERTISHEESKAGGQQ